MPTKKKEVPPAADANNASGNVSWMKDVTPTGEFVRAARTFRDWIKADGSTRFLPEPNRYHLYISLACPWASRVNMMRSFKGLEDVISMDVVDIFLDFTKSWSLTAASVGATIDHVNNCQYLKDIYFKADPSYNQSFTVPVLWDKKLNTIVNNESSEIIRMLNSEFNQWAKHPELDFYPTELRQTIDSVNDWVYNYINNGVYSCGFAKSQKAFDPSYHQLFVHLDKAEQILSKSRYTCGERFTEADIRLFTTLIRFDSVYHTHFKCNAKRIVDYPHLWNYTKEIYKMEGVRNTVNFEHIRGHYYLSHREINPFGIIPAGPDMKALLGD